MRAVASDLRFSPSDLGHFVACEHLTQLELQAALGEIEKPHYADPYGELLKRKGDEHEAAFLQSLRDAGHEVVEIGLGEERDFEAAARAHRRGDARRGGLHLPGGARRSTAGAGSPTSSSGSTRRPSSATGPTRCSTRSSRGGRSRRMRSSSASTARRSRASRGVEPEAAHVVLGTERARDASPRRRDGVLPACPRRGSSRRVARPPGDRAVPVRPLLHLRLPAGLRGAVGGGRSPHARRGHPARPDRAARRPPGSRRWTALAASTPALGSAASCAAEAFGRLCEQAAAPARERAGTAPDPWRAAALEDGRGFAPAAGAVAGRRRARPRGPPVLRARARARVPVRAALCDGRRAPSTSRLGARPRGRAGARSSG